MPLVLTISASQTVLYVMALKTVELAIGKTEVYRFLNATFTGKIGRYLRFNIQRTVV